MAIFDMHAKCIRCREKGVGQDACVLKQTCALCASFTEQQLAQLATPAYKARKERSEINTKNSPTPVGHASTQEVQVLASVYHEDVGDDCHLSKLDNLPTKGDKTKKSPKKSS